MYIAQIIDGEQFFNDTDVLNFDKKYNVIVTGLGTAGALAALYSSENGLSVLGIENSTCVGGTHAIGGITCHYYCCPGGVT